MEHIYDYLSTINECHLVENPRQVLNNYRN